MKHDLKIISSDEWLQTLVSKSSDLTVNTCRYDCRNTHWHIPQETMQEHLLIFLEQGFLGMRLAGKKVRFEPGMIVWIPVGATRELWGMKDARVLHHYKIRFNLITQNREVSFSEHAVIKHHSWELQPYFQLLVDANKQQNVFQTMHLKSLLAALSAMFFQIVDHRNSPKTVFDAFQRNIINQYISMRIGMGLSPQELAAQVNLSSDYFSRIFKNTYNVSPRAYIKMERIRYAAHRLTETNITVNELAQELNYNNINLFCRQFKEVYKQTPSQYRKQISPVTPPPPPKA